MSMGATTERGIPPAEAYPISQRRAHAESHILAMAALGIRDMETTISAKVCETYGIPDFVNDLKALKATFRNELSVAGEGI